jgi:hypothetical protein
VACADVHSEANYYWTYQVNAMIYFKSVLAGIVTVVVTTVLYSAVMYAYVQARLWMYSHAGPDETYFVVVHWNLFALPSIVTAIAVFLCGAYWMFRRLRTEQ